MHCGVAALVGLIEQQQLTYGVINDKNYAQIPILAADDELVSDRGRIPARTRIQLAR